MAFIFTCGSHKFKKQIKGAEHLTFQCANCHNFSAKPITDWQWFTFCFIPVIPLSLKPYRDLNCPICNFSQPLDGRQDAQPVVAAAEHGQQPPPGPQGQNGQPQNAYMSPPSDPNKHQMPPQAAGQQQYGQSPPQGYYAPHDNKRYG